MRVLKTIFNGDFLKKIVMVILMITVVLGLSACSKKEEDKIIGTSSSKESLSSKESYKVLKKDDISLEDIKRYIYMIVVNEKASKNELEKISNEIILKAKNEGSFNGLQILFYDGEYAASGESMPSLGKYTYAPEGDFAKAMDVKAGEYDKMSTLNELKEVDWKLRPSEDTQKIISMYNELFKQESEKSSDGVIKDSDIRAKTAELMGIKIEDVDDALVKLDDWIWQE